MAALTCDIVTPDAKLFSGEAYMVVVPGAEGEMGFLHGHVPLVSALANGVVRVQAEREGAQDRYALKGGYVEVTGDKVIILADRAVSVNDIDAAATKAELAELETKVSAMSEEEASKSLLTSDIVWCKVRLAAIGE